ncbi:MAG: hypothetical protein LBH11_02030 [Propionibacteriaceae bacterium]|nr:hypothetical protein [Propionibacteriaceae bacterium]
MRRFYGPSRAVAVASRHAAGARQTWVEFAKPRRLRPTKTLSRPSWP